MGHKFFGFQHLRLRSTRRLVIGAAVPFEVEPPPPPPKRLFAFTVPESGGGARCMDFSDDEDGLAALALHCRADRVIKVIHGHAVEVDRSDVVQFDIGNQRKLDSFPIM